MACWRCQQRIEKIEELDKVIDELERQGNNGDIVESKVKQVQELYHRMEECDCE